MNTNDNYTQRVYMAASKVSRAYCLLSKKSGVNENVFILLYALYNGRHLTQKEISVAWLIPKTTINTAFKECEAKGLIVQTLGRGGREKLLRLTDKGEAYAKQILARTKLAEQAEYGQLTSVLVESLEQYADSIKMQAEASREDKCLATN